MTCMRVLGETSAVGGGGGEAGEVGNGNLAQYRPELFHASTVTRPPHPKPQSHSRPELLKSNNTGSSLEVMLQDLFVDEAFVQLFKMYSRWIVGLPLRGSSGGGWENTLLWSNDSTLIFGVLKAPPSDPLTHPPTHTHTLLTDNAHFEYDI